MSINAISGNLTSASGQAVAPLPSPTPFEAETPKQGPIQPGHDTVKLSGAALAR